MKTKIIIFLFFLGMFEANAQISPVATSDTARHSFPTPTANNLTRKQYNLYYGHHSFCAAIPIAVAGLALTPIDHYVCDKVQTGIPGFQLKFDDYM